MRSDVAAPAYPTQQSREGVTVTLFPAASPLDLLLGTPDLEEVDLTPYVEKLTQKASGATLQLRHRGELAGAARPRPGQSVEIRQGADLVWRGLVDTDGGDRWNRGDAYATMKLRRRDAHPLWRETRRMTGLFSVGVDCGAIARDVAERAGLSPQEYVLPDIGVPLAHDATQLADATAWEMLRVALEPALLEPVVDARGVLKRASRDLRRDADLVLPAALVQSLDAGRAAPAVTAVRVRWLDPELSRVEQQDRALASASLTSGPFRRWNSARVWWSDDHRLRCDETRLVTVQDINEGGLPGLPRIADVSYEQIDQFGGRIRAEYSMWNDLLISQELGLLLGANAIGHEVQVGPSGTGETFPWRYALAKSAAELLFWTTVLRQGVGVYEVWGKPYDYVHLLHEVEAYDQDAPAWSEAVEEIQNELVPSEAVASSLAVGELRFRTRAASSATLTIADDLRVEQGDLLELPDGRRFYVADFTRDLTRGADALLEVEGFLA